MRCSCTECGTYMVHQENAEGCICPACTHVCRICLGEGFGKPGIVKSKDGKVIVPEEIKKRYGLED